MRVRRSFLFWLIGIAACGDPKPTDQVSGSIEGSVYLTAPVGGVVVTAYRYDLATGAQGSEIAHSTPTTPDGGFKLDLGIYFGPVLLVARGNGATYTEAATGSQINWDAAQEIRAAYGEWSATKELDFDFRRGTHATGVVIGPFSDLAFALAVAKQSTPLGFTGELQIASRLFRDHVEADYWTTVPTDLTTGGERSWQAPVALGLELAGLSELSQRIAHDSMTGGISSIQLLRALERDAEDGVFDGKSKDGQLTLGTCMGECKLSSQTLRADLADSMATFLLSPANKSTISPNAANDFFVRVAMRKSELFPADAQDVYDVTPPTILVVENTAVDEGGLSAAVSGGGTGSPVYTGTARTVALNATTMPAFSRYASHYGPTDAGIPKWRFQITDDRSDEKNIDVKIRLVRDTDGVGIGSWFKSPWVAGSGYNHELAISSQLAFELANLSGVYRLEVFAKDEKGNVSPITVVRWNQTILAAPIRQRTAPACNPATDGQCPEHYSLQGSLDAAVPINGVGLTGGSLRIGHLYIDNPNPVPVRVNVVSSVSLTFSRGRKGLINPYATSFPFTAGCMPNQLPDGSCYTRPVPDVEDLLANQTVSSVPVTVHVFLGGSEVGSCSGCVTTEREIPPGTTAEVWVQSGPYSFLWGPYAIGNLGSGFPGGAIGSWAEQWVAWCPGGSCTISCRTAWWLTRIAVDSSVLTTLWSRPPDGRAPLAAATGTSTAGFGATPSSWHTHADGEPSF